MHRNGASYAQIKAYAATKGYVVDPPNPDALKYAKENPSWNPYAPAGRMEKTSLLNQFKASRPGAATTALATSALAGYDDELMGALAALGGGDYTTNRDMKQGEKQALRDLQPSASLVGDVLGGLVGAKGAGALLKRVAPGTAARIIPAAINNPVRSATVYGGVYGSGENNQDRMMGAVQGALGGAIGGGVGKYAVAPALRRLASSSGGQALAEFAEPVAARVRNAFGVQRIPPAQMSGAERAIGGQMDNMPAIRGNIADAADMGLPYSLADADPRLRMLAGTVARKSPDARAMAEDLLEPRAMGQIDRLTQGIDDNLAPRTNIEQRSKDLIAAGNQEASPYYNMARAQTAPIDAEINALLETPAGRDAIARA
ncbi:MAG: hypothetical protein ACRCYS_05085, partial [Beijerinckiaceae bacterium]